MKIQHLKIINFRNYERLELDFNNNYNIFYGYNGSGKTNLVEAIYVLAITRSFRGTVDKVLIMNNKDYLKIDGLVEDEYKDKYSVALGNNGKNVKINDNKINKLSDYISKISVVLFCPDNLRFIKDSPGVRRDSINIEISQLNNLYLKCLNQYNKVLKQRNNYLKTMNINGNSSQDYLNVLTDKLIDNGLRIYEFRKKYIGYLNDKLSDYYYKICNNDNLCLDYISDYKLNDKSKIMEKYKENLNRDIILGKTSFGIHHDDIKFKLDGKNIKDFGSEGQQKNAIIAYKLSLIDLFKEKKGHYPILILDDLFSELDKQKINNILNLIDDSVQTFITTTEIDKINLNVIKKSKIFHVIEGTVRED